MKRTKIKGGYIMSTHYKIIVESESKSRQHFYFFQQPAEYVGGVDPYTNSMADGILSPDADEDQLVFTLEEQYRAGAQKTIEPPKVGEAIVGKSSQVEIELASDGKTKNSTELKIDNDTVHLEKPVFNSDVSKGSFRICIPQFDPSNKSYIVGLGSINEDNEFLLSSFINADPKTNVDVKPIMKFYVATGNYTRGTVVDFTQSSENAAVCDATDGTFKFKVTYTREGEWKVEKLKN